MEGWSWCEWPESTQPDWILVQILKAWISNCHHLWLKIQGVVRIVGKGFKSEPCVTIHSTYNKILEGLRCCDILESIQKYTILVWNVGYRSENCHQPLLKSRGVVMVIHDELKSEPCVTIHSTYNKILEGLRCCELPQSVHQSKLTESWGGEKWKTGKPTFAPSVTENHALVTILGPTHQSEPSTTIHYTYNEKLKGLRCCDIL